jgi:branched-chain amino acid transport system permease protein
MEFSTVIMQAFVSGFLNGGIYALVAIGLTLIWGVMNIVNFAHGSMMMLGMYISYWLFAIMGIDPYLSLLFSIPCLYFFGVVVQKYLVAPVLGRQPFIQVVLTLGLMLVLENMVTIIFSPDYRSVTVSYGFTTFDIFGVRLHLTRLIACVAAIMFTLSLYLFLKKTDLGKAIRAASQQKEGAMLAGVDVAKINRIAFGIGAASVGAAGSLIIPFLYAEPHVGLVYVIIAFVIVVMGGFGNFVGALIAGLVIGVAESLGGIFMPGSTKHVITFGLFILVLLFKPTGLLGTKA